ncbi:DUF2683 family protein [Flavobacterium sp.]|jgi:hypothetical protein|uniref:DUF2683 family protein n=1 Tax=Flavobacterium sp. TaxID=239 RepID=UPI0037C0B077
MTTFTIKINKQTKAGKAFMAMSETFFKGVEGIEIIQNVSEKKSEMKEIQYNPEFVTMVLESAKSKNRTTVNSKDLWQSI